MSSAKSALDAICHEMDVHDAEERGEPEDEALWAEGLVASFQLQIAQRRRELLRARSRSGEPFPRVVASSSLSGLTREQLLAQIQPLLARPECMVQLAYRDLEARTDNDLRLLLTLLSGDADDAPAGSV
jgi:hypothetical protein